jgi:hypothetical protein
MSEGNQPRIGPHSRLLQRGTVDGRSREGRYLRAIEARLLDHIGAGASCAQRMLINRLARVALRLELFDEKMAAGPTTDHDGRVYGALHNSFRLMLREIGLKAMPAHPAENHLANAVRATRARGAPSAAA